MMNRTRTWMCILACLVVSAGADADLFAQQAQGSNSEQEVLTEKWMEFMTPGAEHELLRHRVGKWTVRMEMWTAPGAASVVSEATADVKLIMGGRYLTHTTKGSFQGQPFQGISIIGYDKLKKKFMSVWIDNFGTGFTISSGTYDEGKQVFNYSTMSPDVTVGDYKRTRTVEHVVSQDEWVLEMFDTTADGKEFLTMKALYKRVKP